MESFALSSDEAVEWSELAAIDVVRLNCAIKQEAPSVGQAIVENPEQPS
jgi:hypothetical protein